LRPVILLHDGRPAMMLQLFLDHRLHGDSPAIGLLASR